MEDIQIRYFLTGTFFRLIHADDIVIKRRLNNIDISLYCYEHMAKKGTGNPSDYKWRGTIKKKQHAFFVPQTTAEQVKSLSWLKGYSEEMLEAFTHCNVKIHLHLVQNREYVYKSMDGIKNNSRAPRLKKLDN